MLIPPRTAPKRRRKYVRDLETLVQQDPNDVEAKAFLALQIWKNGSWMTTAKKQVPIASHQAVDAILDQIFKARPMHPAHHYRIHLWDDEKPARALTSASLCGQTSPSNSRTCGTCLVTPTRNCTGMPTRRGSRKLRARGPRAHDARPRAAGSNPQLRA